MRIRNYISTVSVIMMMCGTVLAEGNNTFGEGAPLADWMTRLPIIFAIIVLVILVDTAFMVPALRRLNKKRERVTS